jgi:uncharacterized protein (DUF3820 family)
MTEFRWPFGAYKNMLMSELPYSYLVWVLGQDRFPLKLELRARVEEERARRVECTPAIDPQDFRMPFGDHIGKRVWELPDSTLKRAKSLKALMPQEREVIFGEIARRAANETPAPTMENRTVEKIDGHWLN